jgi:RHS repeat-associated protein
MKLDGDLESDWGFTGHFFHLQTALHLAPLRAYDADVGRWLSRDPMNEGGGINLYKYAGNNPASFIDRLGLDTVQVGDAEICAQLQKLNRDIGGMVQQGANSDASSSDYWENWLGVFANADTDFHDIKGKQYVYTGQLFPELVGHTFTGSELNYIGEGYAFAVYGAPQFVGTLGVFTWRAARTGNDLIDGWKGKGKGTGNVPGPFDQNRYAAYNAGFNAIRNGKCNPPPPSQPPSPSSDCGQK